MSCRPCHELQDRVLALERQVADLKVWVQQKQIRKVSFSTETEKESSGLERCLVCKGSHFLETCLEFGKLNTRKKHKVVKKSGTCFHCLKGVHRVNTCTNEKDRLCGVQGCVKFHHPLIHPEKEVQTTRVQPQVWQQRESVGTQTVYRSITIGFNDNYSQGFSRDSSEDPQID